MKTQLLYKGAALAIAALLLSSASIFADKRVKVGDGPIMLHINNQTNNNYILRGTADQLTADTEGKFLTPIPAHQTTIVEGIEVVPVMPGNNRMHASGQLILHNPITTKSQDLAIFTALHGNNNITFFMYAGLHDEKSDTNLQIPTKDFARTAIVVNIRLYEEAGQLKATVDLTSTGS